MERAVLSRVRLRARRRALWLRQSWSSDENATGLAITHTEADRILADPSEIKQAEVSFYESNQQARELSRLIVLADKGAEEDERWQTLLRLYSMSQEESDLLALAVLVVADPAFARVCAYLQDDATAGYATPLLAAAIFDWPPDAIIPSDSVLLRWRFASVPQNVAAAGNAPWMADSYIVQWLLGGQAADPLLETAAELISQSDVKHLECLDPVTLGNIRDFLEKMREAKDVPAIELELIAPEGSGKRTLAAQACSELERDLLVVDARALALSDLPFSQRVERIIHAARMAQLHGAVLYWNHSESLDSRTRKATEGLCDLTFFGSAILTTQETDTRSARHCFDMNALRPSQRIKLWQQYTNEPAPAVISEWDLRPGEIRAAARSAIAGPEAVLSACRRMLHQEPGELLTSLKCPYVWDDIVLTADVRKQLCELSAQARLRDPVLDEWGFDRLCAMGRGITALFAGPSGCGKTMAAQVLARELNRELLRVDLAGVVNKYIGETEKRLRLVFEACERSAVVLFFDEADALFGQRTQVKDAHDRYANIQIDYLLQRMEQFDGIAILATNRKNDLDSAFLRRLRFIVDFHPPGPAERVALWRLALAERSPTGEELLEPIDWNWLADKLTMTGADIKATALAAAFLARAEGSRIRTEHLLHAARREMTKQGTAWRAGEWRAKVL
jgi:AAA+ superfamily predicted ATPase